MLHNNLAQEYYEIGEIDSAIVELEKTLNLNPAFPGTHCLLGICYYNKGELKKSKEILEKLITTNTTYAPAYYLLGNISCAENNLTAAIDYFKHAIKASNRYFDAYYSLAVIYKDILQPQLAIETLKNGIENCPDNARLYNLLGLCLQDMDRFSEAQHAFIKAIKYDNKFGAAYNNLAALYFYMNQYDQAVEYADKALFYGYSVNSDFLEELKKYRKK